MASPTISGIFTAFLRLGCTAFGGPAMIPYIRRMAVDRRKWLTEDAFRVGMSLSQAIPGATAMQVAAYVGLRARGVLGGLAAYAGFGLPAFAMILALSYAYAHYRHLEPVLSALAGLKVVVVALVAHASLSFARKYLETWTDKFLALAAGIWLGLGLNPIPAIVGAALLAIRIFPGISANKAAHADPLPSRMTWIHLSLVALIFLCFLVWLLPLNMFLFQLATLMIRVDLFAFGGGYVSLPLMLHEVVEARHMMTATQFMDGIALGQVTPGPIVMSAAFVGYFMANWFGALVATLAVFAPSFFLLAGLAPVVDKLLASNLFSRALHGSLVTLVGLMAAVTGRFMIAVQWNVPALGLFAMAFTALRLGVDILWVVLICGAASLFLL